MPKLHDSKFFLFKLIKPDTNLTRDEPSMLTKILSMSVLLFVLIDMMIIGFYIKTNRRLDVLQADNYTQVIINSIDTSTSRHEDYAAKTRKNILNDRENIRNFINDLQFFAQDIENLDVEKLVVPNLDELLKSTQDFNLGRHDVNLTKLESIIHNFGIVEKQIKQLNNYLMPVDLYDENEQNIQIAEETINKNLQQSLRLFLAHLQRLDEVHTENQRYLSNEMQKSIVLFEESYKDIFRNHKFIKAISFVSESFNSIDNAYLTFNQEFTPQVFGTQLTSYLNFELKNRPRLQYCVIQLFASSHNSFNVQLQYIDRGDLANPSPEKIIFESYKIKGGHGVPFSYNEVKVFNLDKGHHSLYLRVISTGGASQLTFSSMKFDCLTFRDI